MKLINQNDYPDVIYVTKTKKPDYISGLSTTIATSGCGICCGMMIAEFFGYELSLEDAIQIAYDYKANTSFGTKYKEYSLGLCDKFNLGCIRTDKKEEFRKALEDGNCVLINVGGDHDDHIGVFSHVGHYMLAIGIDGDTVKILDPGIEPNKYLEENRVGKVKVDGDFVYGNIDDLMKDVENREYPFFIFYKLDKECNYINIDKKIEELYPTFINIWKDVVSIESPTSYKQGVDEVGKYFIDYGYRNLWDIDVLHNEVAGDAVCLTMNSDVEGKPMVLSGHMDTVHPLGSYATTLTEDKIYGPGCTDCKGGLIIALLVMKALKECGYRDKKVMLLLQSDEEVGSRLSNHKTIDWMVEKSKDASAFFNLEMNTTGTIVIIRKGIERFELKVTGVSAHSSMCYDGKNAICEAAHKIIELEKYKQEDGVTISCNIISGGTAVNTVPENCNVSIDVRFSNEKERLEAEAYIKKVCETSTIEGTTCTVEAIGTRKAMEYKDFNKALVDKMNEIWVNNNIEPMKYRKATGGSDAAYTTIAGIPTIDSIGARGGYIHTPREYGELISLKENSKRLACVIYDYKD